jgi:muramoyltetrapeptide carboxypeptidase
MFVSCPVRPGETVAVVSPSGPSAPDDLAAGVAWLRERYRVRDDPRRAARAGYLAGDDDVRAAALLDAARDPEVRAVWVARGGYGAMRVLERVGPELLAAVARDPKPLVGFSDVTALHAAWRRAGARTLHAPMVAAIGRGDVADAARRAVVAALEGGDVAQLRGLAVWTAGAEVHGRAAGGNLALVAALAGTPYAVDARDAVLFLEDVGEAPYRLDRTLTTLRLAGALAGVRAVVLGEFTACEPARDGTTAEAVLRDRLGDLGVPVLAGAPFGHGAGHAVVPLGARAAVSRDGAVAFLGEDPA